MKTRNKKRLYIAYGSNLNLEQMALRCPTAKPVGAGKIEGYALVFRGGVANIEPSETSDVPALVWDIRPDDEAALDRYEGYPTLYIKRDIEVETDREIVTAMAYVMARGIAPAMPSRAYYETIRRGYEDAGFDETVLEDALDLTERLMAQEWDQKRGGMEWGW
ncbi:MAG: gamma-glutamylcyclotransferase [Oscillospiraceae bacterium]|nr:gamma-glutamylcyclotransferase [Oscillospiraceae bacterium]